MCSQSSPGLLLTAVVGLEGLGIQRELEQRVDFLGARPDVAQPHVAVLALAHGFGHQVARDGAGQGIGHDQRRRCQEVGLDVRVDASLEVAIARQHGGADQVVADDGLVQVRGQVAGVADGGAAVGGHVEAQLFQVGQEARLGQVFGDHARSGASEVLMCLGTVRPASTAFLASRPAASSTLGLDVLVQGRDGRDQDVAVLDLGAGAGGVGLAELVGGLVEAVLGDRLGEQIDEGVLDVADLDAVLRTLRAGQRRRHGGQVQRQQQVKLMSLALGTPNIFWALK